MLLALLKIKFLIVKLLEKYEFCKPTYSDFKFNSFRGIINLQSLKVAFKERVN